MINLIDKRKLILSAAALVILGIFLSGVTAEPVSVLRSLFTVTMLLLMAFSDERDFRIPNSFVLLGMSGWLVFLPITLGTSPGSFTTYIFESLAGAVSGAGLLFIITLFVPKSFGMGDVKMIFFLGLMCGISHVFEVLFIALICMSFSALISILGKRSTIKSALPMAPYTLLGFCLCLMSS